MSDVQEQYVIQRKLGEGGMGIVYLAEDKMLERQVAIKVLHPALAQGSDSLGSRFQQEALALARLNHPNITHLYAFIPQENTYWMVMEFVDGKTIEDWLKIKGTLSPVIACSILSQMLDGLEHAHRKGIIHRDLKPANIMISQEGEVKIMDFGIARIRNSQRLTQHGKSVGTLEYMAPEQIQGKEGDELTDIYAAGNILYELLSGQTPFNSGTDYHLMKSKLEEKAPLLPVLAAMPQALQYVIFKALERNPEKRFPDIRTFKAAVQKAVSVPLLQPNELANELAAGTIVMNKTIVYPAVDKQKSLFSSLTDRVSFKNILSSFSNWNSDKAMKLFLVIVVVCTGLIIWVYFKPDNTTVAADTATTIKQEQSKTAEGAPPAGQLLSDSQVKAVGKVVPVPVSAGTAGEEVKEPPVTKEETSLAKEKLNFKKEESRKKKQEKTVLPPQQLKTAAVTTEKQAPVTTHKPEPSGPVRIPEGRKITVVLDENLSSEDKSRDGSLVHLHCGEDVVVNGKTIVRKGTNVTGKIVDVIPSGGRRKPLIGFVLHSVVATDGSTIRLRSERYRQQSVSNISPSIYRQGTSFTAELTGRGVIN
ncbi:MAG: serine/threonine protein kinase [Bacteroidetes bacterium]|nr:serine/threonine protein kinase [Bacteroidota bacterium]